MKILAGKVALAAGLLFGTGVATGFLMGRQGLGRDREPVNLPASGRPSPNATEGMGAAGTAGAPGELVGLIGVERADRSVRSNGARVSGIRLPGLSRLELFKRLLGELELSAAQRVRVEAHFRESQEHLRGLLKPLQPEAARELKELRTRLLEELTPEQRMKFDQLVSERGTPRTKPPGR